MDTKATITGFLFGTLAGVAGFVVLYRLARPEIIKAASNRAHDDVERQLNAITPYAMRVFEQAGINPASLVQSAIREGLEKLP